MVLYFSTSLPRDPFLKEAFARENLPLPESLPRTDTGKPFVAGKKISLTHTAGLIALAAGEEEVGLDAERRVPRRTDALSRRLSEREKREDLYALWTAKEAFVKYAGGTLASLLPRLEYAAGTLFLDGKPAPVCLRRLDLEGCTLCLCTAREVEVSLVRL